MAALPLFPVAALFAPLGVARCAHRAWKTRSLPDDALAVVWLAAGYASLLLTPSTYARFHLILFPPVAFLGALGLDVVWQALTRFRRARWSLPVLVAIALAYLNGVPYRDWYQQRTYSVRDTNRKIARLVGNRKAVFIGMWAPWLTFDTRYEFYTVRSYFNVSKSALKQLGVTHLLLRQSDQSGSHYRSKLPREYANRRVLKRFRIKGERLTLYEVRRPAR